MQETGFEPTRKEFKIFEIPLSRNNNARVRIRTLFQKGFPFLRYPTIPFSKCEGLVSNLYFFQHLPFPSQTSGVHSPHPPPLRRAAATEREVAGRRCALAQNRILTLKVFKNNMNSNGFVIFYFMGNFLIQFLIHSFNLINWIINNRCLLTIPNRFDQLLLQILVCLQLHIMTYMNYGNAF